MKYKRVLVTVLLIVFSLVIIAGLVVQTVGYVKSNAREVTIPDFKKYQDSFELVADKLWEIYSKEKEEKNINSMQLQLWSKDSWGLQCYWLNEDNVVLGNYGVEISLSEELGNATLLIDEAFGSIPAEMPRKELIYIDVRDNKINFHTYMFYEIICTKSEVRPTTSYSMRYMDKTFYVNRINKTFNPFYTHFNEPDRIWYEGILY